MSEILIGLCVGIGFCVLLLLIGMLGFWLSDRFEKKSDEWDGEHCQDCGRPYGIGYNVPDEIWDRVAGDVRLLCLMCFDRRAKALGLKNIPVQIFPAFDCLDAHLLYEDLYRTCDQCKGTGVQPFGYPDDCTACGGTGLIVVGKVSDAPIIQALCRDIERLIAAEPPGVDLLSLAQPMSPEFQELMKERPE